MMKRKKSLSVIKRNTVILENLKDLKADHPFWGIEDAGLISTIGKICKSIRNASIG